jgi:hypothetical protein
VFWHFSYAEVRGIQNSDFSVSLSPSWRLAGRQDIPSVRPVIDRSEVADQISG